MAKRFAWLLSAALLQQASAGGFQLWEQDAGSMGNYHAGRAAIAEDASTSFYNPAGLLRIKNQQFVVGDIGYVTDYRFRGSVSGQSDIFFSKPFGHYAAPINDCVVFAFSAVSPFGFKTDYLGTLSSIDVLDLSPALGVAINDKISIGVGLDFEHIAGNFYQGTPQVRTGGNGNDYGYHVGLLYQFTPCTRVGLSYHSKVAHCLTGSNNLHAHVTLPPTTSLSIFHALNNCWDVMGTVTYTQWHVFKNLFVFNAPVLQGFHNSWNYAIGANFHATDKIMLRTGVGYDQTPVQNSSRNIRLPDSDKIAVALGGHFQACETIGFDAGWTHNFAMNTRANSGVPRGSVRSSEDVYGLQVKWDIL